MIDVATLLAATPGGSSVPEHGDAGAFAAWLSALAGAPSPSHGDAGLPGDNGEDLDPGDEAAAADEADDGVAHVLAALVEGLTAAPAPVSAAVDRGDVAVGDREAAAARALPMAIAVGAAPSAPQAAGEVDGDAPLGAADGITPDGRETGSRPVVAPAESRASAADASADTGGLEAQPEVVDTSPDTGAAEAEPEAVDAPAKPGGPASRPDVRDAPTTAGIDDAAAQPGESWRASAAPVGDGRGDHRRSVGGEHHTGGPAADAAAAGPEGRAPQTARVDHGRDGDAPPRAASAGGDGDATGEANGAVVISVARGEPAGNGAERAGGPPPAAPAGGGTAARVAAALDQLRDAGPPRSVSLEVPELAATVRVSLRGLRTVDVRVDGLGPDGLAELVRALEASVAGRGLTLGDVNAGGAHTNQRGGRAPAEPGEATASDEARADEGGSASAAAPDRPGVLL